MKNYFLAPYAITAWGALFYGYNLTTKKFTIMAKLLLNECKDVEGTWYAPEKWLEEQRDVKCAELWNTTSSAGDWDGYFVQKYKGRYWLILFWQENMAWTPYFRLTTANNPIASFDRLPTKDECDTVREEYGKDMLERISSPLAKKYN